MTEAREWRVTGMDCGACAAKVRGAVERLPGVSEVDVTLMNERLKLTLDPGRTSPERVEKTVKAIGYRHQPEGGRPRKPRAARRHRARTGRERRLSRSRLRMRR